LNINNYIPVGAELRGEPALACPVCGDQYVHPVELECVSPGTQEGKVTIDAGGIAIDPRHPCEGRGVRITLKFFCEQGHLFEYHLHFSKGSTLVERYASLSPATADKAKETIWRD
jgi:hypothetical protein